MAEVLYDLDRQDGVAQLVIDTAGPVNAIGPTFVADLEAAFDRALADRARAVVLRSGKARSFLDGADLAAVRRMSSWEVRSLLQRYQLVLKRMATAPLPVLALLEGTTALGGGFELLLWACDQVIATPGAKVGLPEVKVGLFPAAGGTHTLPRLLGYESALEMMLSGRTVPADDLADAGLVTGTRKDPMAAARGWLEEQHEAGPVSRREPDNDIGTVMQRIAELRKRHTRCAEQPWYAALLGSVADGLGRSVPEAAADDVERFLPLLEHPNTRAAIDLFFLTVSAGPRVARVDERKARSVGQLAVIGAGLMGQGIAQVAADRGIEVVLVDVDQDRLDAARDAIGTTLGALVQKGRWSSERRARVLESISGTLAYEDLVGMPLVIEAVFEDLELKRRILRSIQEVDPEIVFASNTSTIPMAAIADGAIRPDQVVGMHFFSPVPLMALLEVIQGPETSREALATAVTCGRSIGKTCILVGDGPGFYTSRTFGSYVLAGFHLLELGLAPEEVDSIATAAGFPQGPLHVYGTAGGEVIYHAARFMAEQMPHHSPPATLNAVFRAGYTGAGRPSFYLDAKGREPDPSAVDFIVRRHGPRPSPEEARDVLLLAMINEAFRCLGEGIVRDLASMELGAVLGIGFPACWHGPGRYISHHGIRCCRDRLAELSERFAIPQLAPSPELDRLLACGVEGGLI